MQINFKEQIREAGIEYSKDILADPELLKKESLEIKLEILENSRRMVETTHTIDADPQKDEISRENEIFLDHYLRTLKRKDLTGYELIQVSFQLKIKRLNSSDIAYRNRFIYQSTKYEK